MSISYIPTPKYSYYFAQNVVEQFLEKYTRGWYFCAKMLGVTPAELEKHAIAILRSGSSVRWETFKKSVKAMEWERFSDYRHLSMAERKKHVTFVKYFSQDDVLDEKIAHEALDNLNQQELF